MKNADSSGTRRVTLAERLVRHWHNFFNHFRPDEANFELADYREDAANIDARLRAVETDKQPDPQLFHDLLDHLDQFGDRRHQDYSKRIDELTLACEQMRARAHANDLARSCLEDEVAHCTAIISAAIKQRGVIVPDGKTMRLHTMLTHLLANLEPTLRRIDTATFQRQATPKPKIEAEAPESLFDYERLQRLFRRG